MGSTGKPLLIEPTEEEHKTITGYMLHTEDLIVKKYKTRARIWCGQCSTEKTIPLELAKQVEKARICPCCFCAVNIHKSNWVYRGEALIRDGDVGWYYSLEKKICHKPKVFHRQVAYWEGRKFYARNLYNSMYGWKYIDKFYYPYAKQMWGNWKKRSTSGYNSLDMQFYDLRIQTIKRHPVITKRQWLENLCLPNLKSNQKKLVIDNHFNRKQIMAIRIFDLKTASQVYKYRSWIDMQKLDETRRFCFNVYYLDYMYRNKIRYTDYLDYMEQCEMLDIKYGKPKDFYKTHAELGEEIKIMEESKKDVKIRKIYDKLMDKSYRKGNIEIRPFMNCRDLVETGAQLHNCLSSYVDKYAKGHTDLYVLEEGGKKLIAIEVYENQLEQARADHNRDPETKYKRIINKWYKENYAKGTA